MRPASQCKCSTAPAAPLSEAETGQIEREISCLLGDTNTEPVTVEATAATATITTTTTTTTTRLTLPLVTHYHSTLKHLHHRHLHGDEPHSSNGITSVATPVADQPPTSLSSLTSVTGVTGGQWCSRSWDKLACWPQTMAGTLASMPCLKEVNNVPYDTSQNITRYCDLNATWEPKANYSMCRSLYTLKGDQYDPDDVTSVYYIGYCISVIALTIALIIFFCFKELRCIRNTIHTNLMITYLSFNLVWIITNHSSSSLLVPTNNQHLQQQHQNQQLSATLALAPNQIDHLSQMQSGQSMGLNNITTPAAAVTAPTDVQPTPQPQPPHLKHNHQDKHEQSVNKNNHTLQRPIEYAPLNALVPVGSQITPDPPPQDLSQLSSNNATNDMNYPLGQIPPAGPTSDSACVCGTINDNEMYYKELSWELSCYLFIMLIYFMLTNFFWMFVEGLYLYALVVRTFSIEFVNIKMYLFIGWGIPAMFVSAWALLKLYYAPILRTDDLSGCPWQGRDFMIDSLYIVPIIVVLVINIFFMGKVMWVLLVKLKIANTAESKQYKKAAKALLVLIPLLGAAQLIFLVPPPFTSNWARMIFSYFRAFLISLQGFSVAVLYCFWNYEVRNSLRHHWERWKIVRRLRKNHHDYPVATGSNTCRNTSTTSLSNGKVHVTKPTYRASICVASSSAISATVIRSDALLGTTKHMSMKLKKPVIRLT